MDHSREGFRWIVFYDFKKGLTQQQCIESLRSTFGNEAPSEKTVYNWFAEFCRGCASINDEFREGRPKLVVIQKYIDAGRNMIEENRHVSTDFLTFDEPLYICKKCCETLNVAYQFLNMCRKNKLILQGYIAQLNHVTASATCEIEHEEINYTLDTNLDQLKDGNINEVEAATLDKEEEQCTDKEETRPDLIGMNIERNEISDTKSGKTNSEPVIDLDELEDEDFSISKEEIEERTIREKILSDIWDRNMHLLDVILAHMDDEIPDTNPGLMYSEPIMDLDEVGEVSPIVNEKMDECTVKDARNKYLDIEHAPLSRMDTEVGNIDNQNTVVPTGNMNEFEINNMCPDMKCGICWKVFASKGDLTTHMRIHTCTVNLTRLITHVHAGEKKFERNASKKKVIHTGVKKFQCATCKKRFRQSGNLKVHLLIHTGEKKYQCTVCKKRFLQPGYLNIHKVIHTGEKKFQCAVCKKRFSFLSNLCIHRKIHNREQKYQCTVCQKRFTLSSGLKRHKVIHSGV